jgi:hypothetical protein
MLAIALLQVRTPSLPLSRSARLAILGLGIAGICSAFCPDQHFLDWWSSTGAGNAIDGIAGLSLSALCFGAVTTFVFGAGAAITGMGARYHGRVQPLLPATMLVLLLAPGVALQSVGTSWGIFGSWLLGTLAGAYGGTAVGIRAHALFARVHGR